MIIIAENFEENKLVQSLSEQHGGRAYLREDAFALSVWSIDDLKEKKPEISDEDAVKFLVSNEKCLREQCISGGWDFFDFADYSECPSLNGKEPEEEKVKEIVEYIIGIACKSTATVEWYIYAEDVCKELKISFDEYYACLDNVFVELEKRDEIVDVVFNDIHGALVLRLDTNYCKKFEGRIYEYKNGELKKKDSLSDKIEEAAGRVESNVKSERENTIDKER